MGKTGCYRGSAASAQTGAAESGCRAQAARAPQAGQARSRAATPAREVKTSVASHSITEARRAAAGWRQAPLDATDGNPDSDPLDQEGLKQFMSVAARLNYLALDRVDLQFAIQEFILHKQG